MRREGNQRRPSDGEEVPYYPSAAGAPREAAQDGLLRAVCRLEAGADV